MSRHDVETGEKEWLEAFNGGDASGVAAKYSEDGRMLAPNVDVLQGRPAIDQLIFGSCWKGMRSRVEEPRPRMAAARIWRHERSRKLIAEIRGRTFSPPRSQRKRLG